MSKAQKAVYYILLVIISALFIFSGISKLTGNAQAAQGFQMAHLPIWFMYVVGAVEVLGAIALWISRYAKCAMWALLVVLAGAVVTTAIYLSIPMAVFPLVVALVLFFTVRWGRIA